MKEYQRVRLGDLLFNAYRKLPHCRRAERALKERIRRELRVDLADASILATNCIGGELYHFLGTEFTSPLIDTSVKRNEFAQLCTHLREYMDCAYDIVPTDRGFVLTLSGEGLPPVRVRFPHDKTEEIVREKWEKRKRRINYDKLVLVTDDQKMDESAYALFDQVPAWRKICLTARDRSREYDWCYQLKVYEGLEKTGHYNDKDWKNGLWLFVRYFDFVSFLNGDLVKNRR